MQQLPTDHDRFVMRPRLEIAVTKAASVKDFKRIQYRPGLLDAFFAHTGLDPP
ncbi:hypothetical protein [Amycolatopsis vastitatis]|uniref:hypothetical protein n=1 Tax=Amycolatopsis vastitatis TaxID=1905142 RepID=UPI0013041258|nr:hypothetical protein [Amycolatopsis vastitatis]